MSNESDRVYHAIRRFKQLNLIEQLGLIPQSELVLIKIVLDVSKKGERPTVSEIAKRLGVSPPAISRTLKRLREKQYVETVTDEADRRNAYVVVTEKGKRALAEDTKKISKFTQQVFSHLEPGEADQFFCLFERIYQGVVEELENLHRKPGGKQ